MISKIYHDTEVKGEQLCSSFTLYIFPFFLPNSSHVRHEGPVQKQE